MGIFAPLLCMHQLSSTVCDPTDCSLPGSSVPGVFQAGMLERVAIFLLQGNLPNPGIEPVSPALQVDSYLLSHQGSSSAVFVT